MRGDLKMKLVDILARDLKEWPEGVRHIDQSDFDGQLYFDDDGQEIFLEVPNGSKGILEFGGECVSQEEWESARATQGMHIQQVGRIFRVLSSDPGDIARAHISNLIYGAMSKLGSAPTVAQVNAAASALTAAGYQQFEIIEEPQS
jgi:hypothetical protein